MLNLKKLLTYTCISTLCLLTYSASAQRSSTATSTQQTPRARNTPTQTTNGDTARSSTARTAPSSNATTSNSRGAVSRTLGGTRAGISKQTAGAPTVAVATTSTTTTTSSDGTSFSASSSDFTEYKVEKETFNFETIAIPQTSKLEALQKELFEQKQKADEENARQMQGDIAECTKQFNGCMKSGSVCGENYKECASLNSDQINARKSTCENHLLNCGITVAQTVWSNFLIELDQTREENLSETRLAEIKKCDLEIESCMRKQCQGEKSEFEMCFASRSRETYKLNCMETIEDCQKKGSYGYDKVLSLIEKDQIRVQNEYDAWKKACEAIGGIFHGIGDCQFEVELRYPSIHGDPGVIKKMFANGTNVACNAETFGYNPVEGVAVKAKATQSLVTGIATGVGAIGGGIAGAYLGKKFDMTDAEKEARGEAKAAEVQAKSDAKVEKIKQKAETKAETAERKAKEKEDKVQAKSDKKQAKEDAKTAKARTACERKSGYSYIASTGKCVLTTPTPNQPKEEEPFDATNPLKRYLPKTEKETEGNAPLIFSPETRDNMNKEEQLKKSIKFTPPSANQISKEQQDAEIADLQKAEKETKSYETNVANKTLSDGAKPAQNGVEINLPNNNTYNWSGSIPLQ